MDSINLKKIFTIIICIAFIITVLIKKNINKNEEPAKEIHEIFTNNYIDLEVQENIIEDATDIENSFISENEDDTSFSYRIINDEAIKEAHIGVYETLRDNLNEFINNRYENNKNTIKAIIIHEENVEIDKENNKLSFTMNIDKGNKTDYYAVIVTTETLEYQYYDILIE